MTAAKKAQPAMAAGPSAAKAPIAAKPIGRGWGRGQVTIKMTARRKELMSDIALGMANGTTPSDAIDRALEAAWTSGRDIGALERRVESLEDTVEAADGERRREADRTLAALNEMATNLARLHRLIQRLADSE